jgi:hypothetical protein
MVFMARHRDIQKIRSGLAGTIKFEHRIEPSKNGNTLTMGFELTIPMQKQHFRGRRLHNVLQSTPEHSTDEVTHVQTKPRLQRCTQDAISEQIWSYKIRQLLVARQTTAGGHENRITSFDFAIARR